MMMKLPLLSCPRSRPAGSVLPGFPSRTHPQTPPSQFLVYPQFEGDSPTPKGGFRGRRGPWNRNHEVGMAGGGYEPSASARWGSWDPSAPCWSPGPVVPWWGVTASPSPQLLWPHPTLETAGTGCGTRAGPASPAPRRHVSTVVVPRCSLGWGATGWARCLLFLLPPLPYLSLSSFLSFSFFLLSSFSPHFSCCFPPCFVFPFPYSFLILPHFSSLPSISSLFPPLPSSSSCFPSLSLFFLYFLFLFSFLSLPATFLSFPITPLPLFFFFLPRQHLLSRLSLLGTAGPRLLSPPAAGRAGPHQGPWGCRRPPG